MINDILASVITGYSNFYLFLASVIGSYGLATIFLSILVSVLMIYPLRWSGKIALKQQNMQEVLTPQIDLIKQESHGAQQHARIHALYSRYSYHPIYAVRLIAGLFIQLPLLVLSFFMFERLDAINGESFLFLEDLGRPDGLLYAKGNLMPFLMTAINLIAALFVINFSKRDLIQATFVSLLFFALLYNTKSILLLFWTTTNVILLFRNISSYLKYEGNSRFNFRHHWVEFQLLLLRKEVILFFVVFFLYAQLLLFVFTDSFNEVLTRALHAFTIIVLFAIALLHISFYFKGKWAMAQRINSENEFELPAIGVGDILVLLLPVALIVQYALLNQELMTTREQLQFVGINVMLLFSAIWLVPFVLERYLPVVAIFPLGLTLALFYLSMPTFVIMSSWVENPDISLLAIAFAVVFGLLLLLYATQRKMLQALSLVFFTVSTLYTGYKVYIQQDDADANPYLKNLSSIDFSNFIPTSSMKRKPDVYLLTYDSYVGQETMQQYGIDNTAQEAFLKEQGFRIYPHVYSIGLNTLPTMARLLEMSDDLVRKRHFTLAGNALVPAIFKKHGYKTHGVLDGYFLMNKVGYDYSFPIMEENHSVGMVSLFEGLKEGQFRFDLIAKPRNYTRSEWLAAKRSILAANTDYPKFMYTHSGPGHSQNSGTCRPNETELYKERLDIANEEMRRDVQTIFDSNRDAIIIVNGDHGPALTGNCGKLSNLPIDELTRLHLQDRAGTFLAIHWPEHTNKADDDIRVIQDTFEAVFKYVFETESVLLRRPGTATIRKGGIPARAVENGIITVGADQGKPLFAN